MVSGLSAGTGRGKHNGRSAKTEVLPACGCHTPAQHRGDAKHFSCIRIEDHVPH